MRAAVLERQVARTTDQTGDSRHKDYSCTPNRVQACCRRIRFLLTCCPLLRWVRFLHARPLAREVDSRGRS
jgi:hypothetical protein